MECRSLSLHMPPRSKKQSQKAKADADAKAKAEQAAADEPDPLLEITKEVAYARIAEDGLLLIDDKVPSKDPAFWQAPKGEHSTFCCELCRMDWVEQDAARTTCDPSQYPKAFRKSIVNLSPSDAFSEIKKHFRDKHRNENQPDSQFARYFPESYNHYCKGGAPDIKILLESSSISKQVGRCLPRIP